MLTRENQQFLQTFQNQYGRPPRILHVGNIANNAYNNAKLLNEAGFDCDVICYDYYHIMGCPEWEDADFEGEIADQFNPDWASVDLKGFERPQWFVQGSLEDCCRYLIAKRTGDTILAQNLWRTLKKGKSLKIETTLQNRIVSMLFSCEPGQEKNYISRKINKKLDKIIQNAVIRWICHAILMSAANILYVCLRKTGRQFQNKHVTYAEFKCRIDDLLEIYKKQFPKREDKLVPEDISGYYFSFHFLKSIFPLYDIVQAYATDPILPLICDFKPYVAFEHGTLRAFTLGDSSTCRLTSLAYNQAAHVFITNGDCLEYAQKISVRNYSAMVHPIRERKLRAVKGDYEELHTKLNCQYIFFCPLRHDWEIKGTDLYIRALPLLAARIGRCFKLVLTGWGPQVEESRKLAVDLACADLVHWIPPLSKVSLSRMQQSVDIIFDQLALPCFGGTAPEALALGMPVIMSYKPQSTEWIIPEAAPIIPAFTVEDIVSAVETALDQEWRARYEIQAKNWFDMYHASSVVVNKHAETYKRILSIPS